MCQTTAATLDIRLFNHTKTVKSCRHGLSFSVAANFRRSCDLVVDPDEEEDEDDAYRNGRWAHH